MGNICFVGLIFQVFGQGNSIHTIAQGLFYPNTGPYGAVGKYGMLVKITYQQAIAGHIREADSAFVEVLVCLGRQNRAV
jgi:hypothetical protein